MMIVRKIICQIGRLNEIINSKIYDHLQLKKLRL